MFGIKLWSRFGVFRDPLTITQNLSFPIPPKTTIGGMLAAILGIDYADYFSDPDYFGFDYSLVLKKPIQKRSFAQNYIADYTKESETKHSALKNLSQSFSSLESLFEKKRNIEQKGALNESDTKKLTAIDKKIDKENDVLNKKVLVAEEKLAARLVKPKPIFREILISPEYLVFIKNFKYETDAQNHLENHWAAYNFYMGNSEFAANYNYLECTATAKELLTLDSFTAHPDKIHFEPGKKYTNIYAATKTVGNREYREYQNLVFSDSEMSMKSSINGAIIKTSVGEFKCEFI